MNIPTNELYTEAAKAIYKANEDGVMKVAEQVFAVHSANIPEIVKTLPGMNKFLADLQKRSFLYGCIATLYQVEIAANRQAAMEREAIAQHEGLK